eukprot:6576405-Pyramimonas_sp.AAC.1
MREWPLFLYSEVAKYYIRIHCSRRTFGKTKFKPIEQWALRLTKLRNASHVEPVVPHPVVIGLDVSRRECLPRRPWGPVAEPIIV